MGIDPLDEGQLKYLDETKLVAAPTMANVLGYPGFWMREMDSGIDWVRVVHGEQALRVHKPLPTKGTVVGRSRIVDLVDKGAGKGAIVLVERAIEDEETGELLATIVQAAPLQHGPPTRVPGLQAASAGGLHPRLRREAGPATATSEADRAGSSTVNALTFQLDPSMGAGH